MDEVIFEEFKGTGNMEHSWIERFPTAYLPYYRYCGFKYAKRRPVNGQRSFLTSGCKKSLGRYDSSKQWSSCETEFEERRATEVLIISMNG